MAGDRFGGNRNGNIEREAFLSLRLADVSQYTDGVGVGASFDLVAIFIILVRLLHLPARHDASERALFSFQFCRSVSWVDNRVSI